MMFSPFTSTALRAGTCVSCAATRIMPNLWDLSGELRQVFSNLILNAIDALPRNGVLTLNVRDDNQEYPAVRIEVEDNGSGIEEQHLKKIFEPFFTTKSDVGTGLGLWSAKNLVEKHEGQLLAESSAGKTRLTVLLPLARQTTDRAEAS